MTNYTETQELATNIEDAKDEIVSMIGGIESALLIDNNAPEPGDTRLFLNVAEVIDSRAEQHNDRLADIARGLLSVAAEIKSLREAFKSQ